MKGKFYRTFERVAARISPYIRSSDKIKDNGTTHISHPKIILDRLRHGTEVPIAMNFKTK